MAAMASASTGAITAGTSTFSVRPSHSIEPLPAAANDEPTTPPIKACDELDGRPKYQVARFQAIAPTSPPKMISGVTLEAATKSLATVAATFSEMNAPAKLSAAE